MAAADVLARRVPLAHLPTPLESADRLAAAIGLAPGSLFVKRDDCTGLALGGNKARKLEHLCADALARGCDTLVTGGGRQSNHVRMTAAAANRLGLWCTVVVGGGEPATSTGNVLLDELLGADIVWLDSDEYGALEAAIVETCDRLRDEGRTPYGMPVGGASDVGAVGYVRAAHELVGQLPDLATRGLVVTADGSGGTHAGLVAGFGDHGRVLGVDVGARTDLVEAVMAKAATVAALCGLAPPVGQPQVDRSRIGAGYAVATDDGVAAMRLAAATEGLVVDPVYSGKAMAGLVAAAREGRLDRTDPVVFLHTGGAPALFARSFAACSGPGRRPRCRTGGTDAGLAHWWSWGRRRSVPALTM